MLVTKTTLDVKAITNEIEARIMASLHDYAIVAAGNSGYLIEEDDISNIITSDVSSVIEDINNGDLI